MAQLAIESGDIRLAGERVGDGPAVVLLHGLTATRRYVVMGSRLLERSGATVVAYDARGHGCSSPASDAGQYSYESLAGDLRAVLDAAQIERAVVVGASMGAHTAVRFALSAPNRVAGLCLITPAHLPGRERDARELARWDALADGLRSGGVEGFVAAYDTSEVPARWRETVTTVLRQRLSLHDHPQAVADALRVVPRSAPFADMSQLAAIDVPTLVVGSRDEADPRHPLAVSQAWARAIPVAGLEVEKPGA